MSEHDGLDEGDLRDLVQTALAAIRQQMQDHKEKANEHDEKQLKLRLETSTLIKQKKDKEQRLSALVARMAELKEEFKDVQAPRRITAAWQLWVEDRGGKVRQTAEAETQ
eukprot:s1426_g4.t1